MAASIITGAACHVWASKAGRGVLVEVGPKLALGDEVTVGVVGASEG